MVVINDKNKSRMIFIDGKYHQKNWRGGKTKQKIQLYSSKYYHKLRVKALTHYGKDNIAICVRCGYSDMRALSIDHINGGGRKERAKIGGGVIFYSYLIKNNYPSGYQTLCMNCNFIKRVENKEYANIGVFYDVNKSE